MTEAVVAQRNTVDTLGFANPLNLPANAEQASHIKVYGDNFLLTNGVDYTLDGVGDIGNLDEIAGVNVIIEQDVIDAALYDTYSVEHDPPMDQEGDLDGGGLLGTLYESTVDAIMRRVQAMRSYLDRSLRAPPNLGDFDNELPQPIPGRALKWNDTGDGFENSLADPDSNELSEAYQYLQATEDAADAGAASAAAAADSAVTAAAEAADAADSADRAEDAAATAGDLSALLNYLWPTGASMMFNGRSAPANFLKENGAAISRTTYSALWSALHTEATVTVDVTTDLWTWTAHGKSAGDTVRFYNSGGALPTGITANTTYYIISSGLTADAFKVATSLGGSAINMTGTPSGTHTAVNAPHGYGDGSTTFNVPESRGEFFRGYDDGRGVDSARVFGSAQSEQIGPHSHTATIDSGGAHTHTYGPKTGNFGSNGQTYTDFRPASGDSDRSTATITTTSNGDHTHTITINNNSGTENRPRNKAKLMCIKY